MINPERGWRPPATPDHPTPPRGKITAISPGATKGQVLREIFRSVRQAGLDYAVLRNYEGLADQPGRDVDILTNNFEKFKRVIETVSEKAGYCVRIFRHYDGLVKFHLITEVPEIYGVLELDVGWDIRWKGIPLIPPDLLDHHRLWRKDFSTLPPGPEAAISLIKDLIYYGTVKEKYKPGIMEMIRIDRDGFLQALAPTFGELLVSELAELSSRGDWARIDALVPQLRRQAVIRPLRNQPLAQLGRWAAFLWWNLWKFLRPSGLLVVLIGPDGSGKSTLSAGLRKYLSPLFQGTKSFHAHFKNLPRLRDLARLLGFKAAPEAPASQPATENSQAGRPLGRLYSLVLLLYYTLDYLLGYPLIIRSRGQGELIVFDRYIYDYLIQPGMNLPNWLLTLAMRMIPNPDVVVYLKNSPDVILSRKPELTRQELERQGAACDRLISRLPQGQVVETTGTPEETTAQVAKILLGKICRRG
jgi:thymidylate kinase